MNKIWIIIQREFAVKVKKKAFIIMTILMPFLMAAIIFVPALLAQMDGDKINKVAYIDATASYDSLFKSNNRIVFVKINDSAPVEKQITKCLQDEDDAYDAVVYVKDKVNAKNAVTIYSTTEVPHDVEDYVNKAFTKTLRNQKLKGYQIQNVDKLLEDANVEFSANTVRQDKEGNESQSSTEIAGVVGLVMSLIIYMFILSYGGMVMQSVMEEKTNRIVEIMVSSVKPYQLMAGKIIGVALVGLFQFLVWALMLASLLGIAGAVFGLSSTGAAPMASEMAGMSAQALQNTAGAEFVQIIQGMNLAQMLVVFILYFIGGYLLFASMFAAIGASVNEQQDSSQFMMPIVIVFVFALYAGMFSIEHQDGPLAMWCSFIPFTSPVVMMVRIPFQIPLWQVGVSLVILYATAAFILWISAKIYRVGILMYGKKPTFQEMLKWIRFK